MMRVTGGKLKGRVIHSPKNKPIRPTTARVRESVFNQLQGAIEDVRFLDLFAGSGMMGIEAVSRGASFVQAVELEKSHCELILSNYQAMGLTPKDIKLKQMPVEVWVGKPCKTEPFEVVFLDPPYGYQRLPEIMDKVVANGWLAQNGWLFAEQQANDPPWHPEIGTLSQRHFGDTILNVFRYL